MKWASPEAWAAQRDAGVRALCGGSVDVLEGISAEVAKQLQVSVK